MVKLNTGGVVKRQEASDSESKENLNPTGIELKSGRRSFNTKKLRRTVSFLHTNSSPPPSSNNAQNLKSKLLHHIQTTQKKSISKQSFYEQQRRRRLSLNYNMAKSGEIDESKENEDDDLPSTTDFVEFSPKMESPASEANHSSERKAKSFHAIKNQLKKYAEELKTISVNNEKSNSLSSKASKLANKVFKLKEKNAVTSNTRDLNLDMILGFDKTLKTYLETKDSLGEPSELTKKIDFELRILDGILKMLNAQNSSAQNNNTAANFSFMSNDLQPVVTKSFPDYSSKMFNYSPTGSDSDSAFSDDKSYKMCEESGVSIARSIFSSYQELNPLTLPSGSNISSNNLMNSVLKQIELYKCLFVSRRKLEVYLQKLNDSQCVGQTHQNGTGYLILKDLSIPLYNLKWSDHLKAIKINENNESGLNNTGKQRNQANFGNTFAFFALVYFAKLGIVHDTKLLSIDTSTSREISFNQTFKFDNIEAGDEFEIEIEIFSYDLNGLDSGIIHQPFAKRLAKQLGKNANRSGKTSNPVESNNFEESVDEEDESKPKKDKINDWLTQILPNSTNLNTNRFRLVAKACLTQKDLVNSDDNVQAADVSKMSFSEHFFSSNFNAIYEDTSFVYETCALNESNDLEMKPIYKQMLQCKPLQLSTTDGSFFVASESTGSKSLVTMASHSPPIYDFFTCRFYDSSDSNI